MPEVSMHCLEAGLRDLKSWTCLPLGSFSSRLKFCCFHCCSSKSTCALWKSAMSCVCCAKTPCTGSHWLCCCRLYGFAVNSLSDIYYKLRINKLLLQSMTFRSFILSNTYSHCFIQQPYDEYCSENDTFHFGNTIWAQFTSSERQFCWVSL